MGLKLFSKNKSHRWAITDKMFLSLFITGAIIEFSQVGAAFIDGLMISRFLGPLEMAAQGIALPIYSILGVISGLLAVGMEVKCSQAIGRGNRQDYFRFVSATVNVGVVISIVVTFVVLVFSRPLAALLGAKGNASQLINSVSEYLIGLGIGIPAIIMTPILAPALQLDSGRKMVNTGAIIGAIVDVVLDFVAVKLSWGMFGIGLASAISFYSTLIYQCTFFLKKDRILHFVKPNVSIKEFITMLFNGGEKAVKRLANTLRPIILNTIIISYGGATAMSVLSIRNNLANFSEIFGAGVAAAVALLVGVYFGEINEEAIAEVNKCKYRMIFICTTLISLILFCFATLFAKLYIVAEDDSLKMAVFAVRMLALQTPLQALITSRIKYLQSIHKKVNMNLLIVSTKFFLVFISAFVLGRLFGVYGILACYTASDALTLIAVYIYYAFKAKTILPKGSDYLGLPEYFHLNPGDEISLDVRDKKDVSLCSEQIMLFCNGHKIDSKISYYASLAFEELAVNTVEDGFPKTKASHPMIDLRVVISDNKLVIRMSDNCPQYDVTKHMAELNENDSDPLHNIGTKIVCKIASEIIYLRTFDTNCTIIRFDL